MRRIRVLVVDDSLTARKRMVDTISADPQCEVVAEAPDGRKAMELCETLRPDVMTLDMMLPYATGLEVTEHVMAYCPTPIVIVSSSVNRGEVLRTFDALAAGAVDVLEKPTGSEPRGVWERKLLETIKVASRIKVITHFRGKRLKSRALRAAPPHKAAPIAIEPRRTYDLIAIGASTGGPSAVVEILGGQPAPVPYPVLFVIHVNRIFVVAFADWLATVLSVPVSEASDAQPLPKPNERRVIVAPADRHLVLEQGRLRLSSGPERNAFRPSVDVLFESVAMSKGPRAVGCLLTGMGRDGAEGLLAMKQAGATTIAQDESSSVVFGMPREAIRLGAAQHVLSLAGIRSFLWRLARDASR